MRHRPAVTPEMKEFISALWKGYRHITAAISLFDDMEGRILGDNGGIPELRKGLKEVEKYCQEYRKGLRICEKQLEIEAAEVYAIPDLPKRIKSRLVRLGCRTRMDVHLINVYAYNTPGWGRKSESVLNEWNRAHWVDDYEEYQKQTGGD